MSADVPRLRRLVPDRAADQDLWHRVWLAARADTAHYVPRVDREWAPVSEQSWRAHLADPTGLWVVAVADDQPVGVVRGRRDEQWAWLSSLWVAPQARGLGLGGRLIDDLTAWATGWARWVMLSVGPDNEVAIGVYRRHGFEPADLPGNKRLDGRRELIFRRPVPAL